jgi:hypothetical protein
MSEKIDIDEILTSSTIKVQTNYYTMKLSGKKIIELLNAFYDNIVIPDNAEVIVYVPGGGDWSHMDLEIDSDCPLIIRWQTEKEERT